MHNSAIPRKHRTRTAWPPTHWLYTCILGVLSCTSPAFSQVPTFDELKAGYVQNLRACGTLRVTYTVRTRITKDSVENLRAEQAILQEAVSNGIDGDVLQAARDRLDEIAAALPQGKATDVVVHDAYDLWTDHQGLQLRTPSPYHDFDGQFPDAPIVAPSDLVDSYPEIAVMSWPGDGQTATVWPGLKPDSPIKHGVVSQHTPADLTTARFPPLGYTRETWGHITQWHPIDQFFFADYPQNTVVSTVLQAGEDREAWLVRRIPPGSPRGPFLEAVIDPKRGFIPVSIRRFVLQRDDSEFDLDTCLSDTLEEIAPGAWYPLRTTVSKYSQDFRNRSKEAGGTVPALLSHHESWVVTHIDPDADMALVNYHVGLPDMTLYYDELTGKHRLVGGTAEDVDAVMDQILARRSAQAEEAITPLDQAENARNTTSLQWLLFANVLGVLLVLLLYRIARR